jgi:hypothetical protein
VALGAVNSAVALEEVFAGMEGEGRLRLVVGWAVAGVEGSIEREKSGLGEEKMEVEHSAAAELRLLLEEEDSMT